MPATASSQPGSASALAAFLQSLADDGRGLIFGKVDESMHQEALDVLAEIDRRARGELSYEAPVFRPEPALWAATLFYEGCRFTVCRDIGEGIVVATLSQPCPATADADTVWSVDLTFRQLPILFRFARQLSSADPLVAALKQLAIHWPLSSVGFSELGDVKIDSFVSHPGLRRLYADRIMAAGDVTRLGDNRVDDLLRADLGIHRELAPHMAAKLFPNDTKEPSPSGHPQPPLVTFGNHFL